jgi:hypothetical protein
VAKRFSVGKSSYGDLRGIEQYVMSARIALQVLSVIVDFNAWQKQRGAVGALSVNEGMRSRARQTYLWVHRFILAIVVALPFTSRHDEVLHGNAIDFGITMPDQSNRALTAVEFAKLHALVEARGGTWPAWAKTAPEPWHHEMATRTEQLPPYPDAAVLAGTQPPKPTTPPTVHAVLTTAGDDMTSLIRIDKKGQFTVGPEFIHFHAAPEEAAAVKKVSGKLIDVKNAEAVRILRSLGIPVRYVDAELLKRDGWNDTWSRQLEQQGAIKGQTGVVAAIQQGVK